MNSLSDRPDDPFAETFMGLPHEWVAQNAPDGLIVTDGTGHILYCNEAVTSMTGYLARDLIGRRIETLVPERMRPQHVHLRESAVSSNYSRPMGSGRIIELAMADGSEIPVDVAIRTIETVRGPLAIVAVRDDTQRRAAIAAWQTAQVRADTAEQVSHVYEQRFSAGFENAPVPMFVCTAAGVIQELNAAFAELTGYPSSGVIGRRWHVFFHALQGETLDLAELLQPPLHAVSGIELHLQNDLGRNVVVLLSASRIEPADPESDLIVHLIDISDRIATRELRKDQVRVLESIARQQSLGDQIAGIVTLIRSRLDATHCFIFERRGDHLVCINRLDMPAMTRERFPELPIGPFTTPAGHCIALGLDLHIVYDDMPDDWAHLRGLQSDYPEVKATYAVPLRDYSGQIIGAFTVHSRTSEPLSAFRGQALDEAIELAQIALGQAALQGQQRQLEERWRFHASLLDAVGQSVMAVDQERRIIYWNQAAELMHGWSVEEAIGAHVDDLFPVATPVDIISAPFMEAELLGEQGVLFWGVHREGSRFAAMGTRSPVHDTTGELIGEVTISTDVSALYSARREIEYRATHDSVTGLPNRTMLEQVIADRVAEGLVVFVVSIDQFDSIIESAGYEASDEALVAIASRLREWAGSTHTVARMDGGVFALLCACEVETHGEELLALFDDPVPFARGQRFVSASIGAARSQPGESAKELLTQAVTAAHAHQLTGGSAFGLFTSGMRAMTESRLAIENDLRHALRDEQFRMHYQPQIELNTGQVTGVEALLRWDHPELGVVGPDYFLDIAESSSLILPIGLWALTQACQDAALWRDKGAGMTVSVNVSARQLVQSDLLERVEQALAISGLAPERLCLEVTESVLLDDLDSTAHLLDGLRNLGIGLHIDDFGTGYSSLAYLRRLPVTGIKIDRSFVSQLHQSREDRAIVAALVSLGQVMALDVIAEGVEHTQISALLQELGCAHGQGYLWSAALSNDDLQAWLLAVDAGGCSLVDRSCGGHPHDGAVVRGSWVPDVNRPDGVEACRRGSPARAGHQLVGRSPAAPGSRCL